MKLTFWMVEQRDRKAMGPSWRFWTVTRYVNLQVCIFLWFKSLALKLWSMDCQHQPHLWACWKWRISGPTLDLHFSRTPTWFICTQKLEKCYFKPLWIGFLFTYKWKLLIWHPRGFFLRSYNFLQACHIEIMVGDTFSDCDRNSIYWIMIEFKNFSSHFDWCMVFVVVAFYSYF